MEPLGGRGADGGRQISAGITRTVLTTVRRRCGDAGVRRVLELAGEGRSAAELEHLGAWSSYADGRALMEAAGEVLDEPHALRRAGEYVAREDMTGEVVAVLRSLGSPGELLRHIGTAATKFCTVARMEAVEVGELSAIVTARNADGFPRFQEFCDITAGILSQAPIPFGLPGAEVVEETCELRGDEQCRYRVTWTDVPDGASASAAEIASLAARFEAFQATAASLVSAADVDTVLDRIIADVGLAVRAPHHLLAVRGVDGELRVHRSGLSITEAEALAREIVDGDAAPDPGRLVVEVASAQRSYGRLAAIADGAYFFDGEHGLLASYARLAAAALDAATALEESRRQTETAELLLRLARALSNVGELDEMAQRLVESLPGTLDCDVSQVWIWDATTSLLRLGACHGLDPQAVRRLKLVEISMTDTAELPAMVTHPGPLFMDAAMEDVFLAAMMREFGQTAAVAVPITAGPELLGVLTASVRERPERVANRPGLVARLEGCADLASTAFQNARLVGQIRHQALHDAVTGLPNKELLQSRVDNALAAVSRGGPPFALCFLDLDRFKHVNDTLGHAIGDLILHEVGARLTEAMRKVDTVARLGGDEFALLLPEAGTAEAAEVIAERISAVLREPFLANGQPIYITSSVGIALAPAHGRSYDELVRNADVAMYRAKDHGRNRCTVFDAQLQTGPAERLRLESDLHVAIERDELVVLYQPLVHPADGSVVGLEALVRWQHPVLGLLTPDRFLPLAEESYLIGEIDACVLRRACQQLRAWADAGLPPVRVSVNASERTIHDTAFPQLVAAVLRETAVPPEQLEIEVTEHVVDTRTGDVVHVLRALQALGVRLAIDDFGTGNSGLARLRTFPIDTLKIDRSFVAEVDERTTSAPLLSAMIRLGVDLGLEVVAEGVETADQQAFLVDQGCQLAQGYLFARPLSAEDAGRAIAGEAVTGAVPVTAIPTDPST